MKSRNSNTLDVLDNFVIDRNLPKYKKSIDAESSNISFSVASVDTSDLWSVGGGVSASIERTPNIFTRLHQFLSDKLGGIFKKKPITIRQFFMGFSGAFEELSQVASIGKHYVKAIEQAEALNQTAMTERLKEQLDIVKGEAYLIAMGLKLYITEEQVLRFYEDTDENKHLKLTYLKNYVKMIPSDIVELKSKVDERGVFDNYVILHYDPFNNSTRMTDREEEIEKDPILFGVIENSRKLYYIGDWIDEVCDLTLEKMMSELGDEAMEINNKTLKTYIDQSA
jgi:hypothetical protein